MKRALWGLFFLGGLLSLINLSVWQYKRSLYKQQLVGAYQQGQYAQIEPHTHLLKVLHLDRAAQDAETFKKFRLEGYFDHKHVFFELNKTHAHQLGYHLWVPFKLDGGGVVMLNLGWLPQAGNTFSSLPEVSLPETHQVVVAYLRYPRSHFTLGPPFADEHWPRRMTYFDLGEVGQAIGQRIYPIKMLALASDEQEGSTFSGRFIRQWHPVTMTPEKHRAYSFQWAALALTWLVLFYCVSRKRGSHTT